MSKIIQKQIEAYRHNFLKHGTTPLGTFQNNTTTQFERFNQLIDPLLAYKSTDFTICDVGSGVCDLNKFLQSKEIKYTYTGIEVVQEMVDAAKSIYPEITVINQDLLAEDYQEKFDFCVLSGAFNLPGGTDRNDWHNFIFAMIEKMYALSNIGISFNALTVYSTFNSQDLFYLDPKITLDYIKKNLTRHCQIMMSSPLFEDTYVALKPEALSLRYPAPEFDKYFKDIVRK
jgi:hypothetical protein